MKALRWIKLLFVLLVLASVHFSVNASIGQFQGTWVNIDSNTQHITRIIIYTSSSGVTVQTFGSCSPTDCDWGTAAEAYAYGPNVGANLDTDATSITALYTFGFSNVILVIHPTANNQLTVQSYTHFTDGSGRTDYESVDTFVRDDTSTGDVTPIPPDCQSPYVIDFEDISLGSQITNFQLSHTSFQPQFADIAAHDFVWSNGVSTQDGFAEIEDGGLAGGTGNEIEVNNVNISVSAGFGQTMTYLKFQFGEYGGNLNIQINDEFVNFNDFMEIQGQTIGNVSVNLISGGNGNDQGIIEFIGDMAEQTISGTYGYGQFAIGGQELWIDNICFSLNEVRQE